ncbi:Phenylalanyl-tRNA synthetase beta chain [Mycoplasmopsis agalactiae 14628]|uniref:Phenylalanine--tRNA ligase beta subunit n=1 Tax=Mycoplasmopsis agalactiae 14628 TaxID=1110504 RepID=I5D5D6_MYCAA|nr:phenylalanine--tRNA ligase subunit beta [Mycoplasmopsis agalactiae]EIN14895.1 Phenylalanyl-tRNA synthetase beta chain [Mycoplasmopsis agalactiae 14628]
MIISLREINKYMPDVNLDISIEKSINNLGYEVESIKKFSDVKGIKFGYVLDVFKNENSKNLNVVSIKTNTGIITIQTTATNVKKNHWIVAFVEGASKGDIVFGKKEMAGVVSNGMLASYSELGYDSSLLPFDPNGVILLDDSSINEDSDPIKYFDLDDYIIDITTPANRAETNSYYVLAMELAAYYKTKFVWPNLLPKDNYRFRSNIKVSKNEASELTFFEARLKNNKTCLKDTLFLTKHGISAKGLYAVDLTNIALLVTGAPCHVYDKNKIGKSLSCAKFSGELEILGGKKVNVSDVLAIKDETGVISLASVMGCENSAVDENTKEVVFEVGLFDPLLVRHGAREIKMDTASSIQAGRALNSQIVFNGISFLKYKSATDGQSVSQIVNIPKVKKGKSVIQSRKKLSIYANCNIKDLSIFDEVEKTLKKIGFSMDKNRVIAPTYRNDIQHYEDVIEEYFRFYGYGNFKPEAPKLASYKVAHTVDNKNILQSLGYNETRTFSLISSEMNKLNPFNFESTIKLMTFVSKEREEVRNSIIPSLLESAEFNLKRKINNISFFEHGMINENKFVYGLLSNEKSFDEMKQDIYNFLKVDNLEFIPFKDNELIHPNVSAKIIHNGCFIGWIGKVHPSYNASNFSVAEFMNVNSKPKVEFNVYDPSPLKSIDLTFTIGQNEAIASKISEINAISNSFSIMQIDSFTNADKRNVTLRITGSFEEINKINEIFNKK